jgi:hypothetical protein
VTQLIEVLDTIGSQLDLRKQIDVIYLDMSKAHAYVFYIVSENFDSEEIF